MTQFLGRGWYERKGVVDAAPGYRNGYGKPRRLSTCCGTIKIKRPRVRGLKERFESRILPLFARHTKEVGALLPAAVVAIFARPVKRRVGSSRQQEIRATLARRGGGKSVQ